MESCLKYYSFSFLDGFARSAGFIKINMPWMGESMDGEQALEKVGWQHQPCLLNKVENVMKDNKTSTGHRTFKQVLIKKRHYNFVRFLQPQFMFE